MEPQAATNRAESASEFSLDTIEIVSPDHYQKNGYPHAEWTYLRKHHPVFYIERPRRRSVLGDYQGGRHQGNQHSAAPVAQRPAARGLHAGRGCGRPPPELPLRHLLNMDPPQHGEYRSILSQYFTPRSIRALEPEIAKITTEILDDVMDRGECDFVTEISSKVPVAVIAEMLGVPRKDWPTDFPMDQ